MNRTSSLSSQSSAVNTNTNNQFKHTILWNNIIQHLKKTLINDGAYSNGFTTNGASVPYANRLRKQHSRFVTGGMLLIKQNLLISTGCSPHSSSLDNLCFTGSHCVDIIYSYLTSKEQVGNFERQVTRDKVSKLCQSIMDSGVFEPMSKGTSKFDDTLLKFYRFKPEVKLITNAESLTETKIELLKKKESILSEKQLDNSDETNASNKNLVGLVFNKCKIINKTNMTNTKLKRKVTSMRRSSTIQTLMPVEKTAVDMDDNNNDHTIPNDLENIPSTQSTHVAETKLANLKLDASTALSKNTPAQDLLLLRRITRELVVERLLALIDLPVIEKLLIIDERNDIEYREQLDGSNANAAIKESNTVGENSNIVFDLDVTMKTVSSVNPNKNPSLISLTQRSLAILNQTFDLYKCDNELEWRKSALDCLEFIDWPKTGLSPQLKDSSVFAAKSSFTNVVNNNVTSPTHLCTMMDIELYQLIKEFYSQRRNCFLDDSFQPLFTNILLFLRNTQYSTALETLNLGTLLLLKQTQAELKRLLKFLYITANSAYAPRLTENKPNNSILLNHFACSLFNTKLIGFEESRLILNFMLNNFENLFKLNKQIEESICKRRLLLQKYGHEEALIEKLYCKRLTTQEFKENSKDETCKALVDLINHIIDDPQISLKQKKLKLKALQRIHPEVYQKHFANFF